MQIPPATTKYKAESVMKAMTDVEKDPAVKQAGADIVRIEKERDTLDLQLKMPREERFEARNDLYADCWNRVREGAKSIAVFGSVAFMGMGTAIAAYMQCTPGLAGFAGLVALGTLVGTFTVAPRAIASVMKKLYFPPRVDKAMKTSLELEKKDADYRLEHARRKKQSLVDAISSEGLKKAEALPDAAAAQESPQTIDVGDEIVNVAGVKLLRAKK